MSTNLSLAQATQQGNRTTDGKYTFGTHAEPAGLELDSVSSDLDQAAEHYVAELVRNLAAHQAGRWQQSRKTPGPLHETYVQLLDNAAVFEDLPAPKQRGILRQLNIAGREFLLDGGHRLGNEVVQFPPGQEMTTEQTGWALTGQHALSKLDIQKPISLDRFNDSAAVFRYERAGVIQELGVGTDSFHIAAKAPNGQVLHQEWLDRAGTRNLSSVTAYATSQIQEELDRQHQAAMLMEAAASSPSVGAHPELFSMLNEKKRTLIVKDAPGGELYRLDISGREPVLTQPGATKPLHPVMTMAYLDHVAQTTQTPYGGEGLANELKSIFRRGRHKS